MKKSEAENLSMIFGSDQFKYFGLPTDIVVKIVRTQIVVDPIAEEIVSARKKAVKKFGTPRLIELENEVKAGKVMTGTQEAEEYIRLSEEFEDNVGKIMEPLLNQDIECDIPTYTVSEFESICKINEFTGSIPKLLYTLLVK